MKQGQRPKRAEKELLSKYGLNVANWLVTKRLTGEIHLVHRFSGKSRMLRLEAGR